MSGWRIAYVLGLIVFIVLPLAQPFAAVFEAATWRWTEDDATRLRHLALNTLALTGGTVAVAMPPGVLLGVVLFRTSFPGRSVFLLLLALLLFVPVPVLVSSWQAALGADGWLPLAFWHGAVDRPWATGLSAAIWVHALASVPWVACIVGVGLTWVEPELEDEAALSMGRLGVLFWVTLPRARGSILAAALFVGLQTASEISVTDMMLVPTLAEEAFAQFAVDRAGLGRTLALSLPALVGVWSLVLMMVARLERTLPPLAAPAREPASLAPGSLGLGGAAVAFLLLLAPLGSLIWKLGLTGYPGHWSAASAGHFLAAEWRLLGDNLLTSLSTAATTGIGVTVLALAGCWLARDCRWFRWLLFTVVTGAWVMPAPVIGIGLHELILQMVRLIGLVDLILGIGQLDADSLARGTGEIARQLLWHGPSPLPLMWVQTIRALPVAVLLLWPVVRLLPRSLFEEARWSGAGAVGQWLGIVLPLTWRAGLAAALVSAALCLGEVGASTRVETPGWESFAKLIFERMHYGVDNNVSALCVLLLTSIAAACGLAWVITRAAK